MYWNILSVKKTKIGFFSSKKQYWKVKSTCRVRCSKFEYFRILCKLIIIKIFALKKISPWGLKRDDITVEFVFIIRITTKTTTKIPHRCNLRVQAKNNGFRLYSLRTFIRLQLSCSLVFTNVVLQWIGNVCEIFFPIERK